MRKDIRRIAAIAAFGLAAAALGSAQDAAAPAVRHPFLRHHLRECLAILDLSDQQKTDIQAVFDAARPTLESDVAAVRAARQTLEAAVQANPPDACAIGTDVLALKTAREILSAERESVRDQVFAILTPEQQMRLQGCLDAPWPDAAPAEDTAD
jgi:Spy/CpxP family protein refolding chaperone